LVEFLFGQFLHLVELVFGRVVVWSSWYLVELSFGLDGIWSSFCLVELALFDLTWSSCHLVKLSHIRLIEGNIIKISFDQVDQNVISLVCPCNGVNNIPALPCRSWSPNYSSLVLRTLG
jgi:hypothetical protein